LETGLEKYRKIKGKATKTMRRIERRIFFKFLFIIPARDK